MTTDTPPPRRNWHFTRWLIVFIVATLGWSGWRAYAYRSAISQARALKWEMYHTDPVDAIRGNWKAAFKKATWLDGVAYVTIPTSEAFEQHLAIVHRLNPKELLIQNAGTLRDISALSPLTRLQGVSLGRAKGLTNVDALKHLSALKWVELTGCPRLTNVDALKNLSALQMVYLIDCTGLTNVDALKNLTALRDVQLNGCTGLSKESVAALKAALPNAKISGP